MKIIRHRLKRDNGEAYPFVRSPNFGGDIKHEYLVIHYTAGRNAEESVSWLANRAGRASAHVVIGRDGGITQLVPFNRIAWHAGASTWDGRIGLNSYSLGMELDNAGRLMHHDNRWRAWFGDEYDDSDVIKAVHKHETESSGWHLYTSEQIEVAFELASLLMNHYGLLDVIGHDEIARGRKSDPGPAFPMASFRSRLLGRQEDHPPIYETITNLNIRTGPGTQHPTIPGSPLPKGTRLEILAKQGSWCLVDALDDDPVGDMQGWVHGRYLGRSA